MRLQCVWGSARPATNAAVSTTSAEAGLATVGLSPLVRDLSVSVIPEPGTALRFWKKDDGSFIAVEGEFFGSDPAADLPGLWGRLTTSRTETLASFNSSAAIFVWDARAQELSLVRDRYGIAHVFYASARIGLIAATSLQSVLSAGVDTALDLSALDCFLARGFVPAPLTFLSQVRKLGPSELLRLKPGQEPLVESYFCPTVSPQISPPKRERLKAIKSRIMTAVDRRFSAATSPIGVLLSSGIDSGLVLAAARELGARPEAFTFEYSDYGGPFNEGERARALAEHFAVRHHLIQCRPRDVSDALPILTASYGEPLTYGLHSFMMTTLGDQGVAAALTGVGADCFGISDSGFAAVTFQHLPQPMRKVARAVAHAAESSPGWAHGAYALLWADKHHLPSCLHPALMEDEARIKLFNDPTAAHAANAKTLEIFRRIADPFSSREPDIARWRFTGQRCFASEGVLFWNQVWSRASGVALRHPFFDNDLQDYVMRIVPMERGKRYIRELANEMLPSWAARRPKLHHTIPIGHWFRGPLRDLLEDFLSHPSLHDLFDLKIIAHLKQEHLSGKADHGWRLWALLSFVAWQVYVLKPASQPLPMPVALDAAV